MISFRLGRISLSCKRTLDVGTEPIMFDLGAENHILLAHHSRFPPQPNFLRCCAVATRILVLVLAVLVLAVLVLAVLLCHKTHVLIKLGKSLQ